MAGDNGPIVGADAVGSLAHLLVPVHAVEDDEHHDGDDEQRNGHAQPHAEQLPVQLEALCITK